MELGPKIKQLRYKAGMTQEQLADTLGISPQSVSKWENAVAMPDISLLPLLSETFGVSIDELFDLTAEQKLRRIEHRMDIEQELPGELFLEYEEYLKTQLEEHADKREILSLLAHLYHHRMESDAQKVSRYAREAMRLAPEKKDCQWLLDRAEGQCCWDWNISNHAKVIEFYQELTESDKVEPKTPLPYYYLIDNLIADHRTEEARHALKTYAGLPAHKPFMVTTYEAHIALAEYDEAKADAIMEEGKKRFAGDGGFLFELAQYHAKKGEYDKVIDCYEASYASEEDKKPRYMDALQGIARIYEIRGDYAKAAATCDRMLENLKTEWGFKDEIIVQETEDEKARLLKKASE